ncbi:ATP-binding cassette domain-containing protein [Jatrophihabitans telluris]|uniref:ATP-binding cassette domain-containing protein n=1 Tax=Jatrophihabitans telluris TaxID=2038343 RepID=A0ABY4QUT2_9ACTN|nr:ATP-binding cassette domain-containing protein [Jatrophihabitans telluris]UQX87446.1 ATP-binding cassette domain-containing protein [Jatrophihabitans telluris]
MISVRDLHKHYGTARAVDGLSFEVRPGHVTGFLGPNGAGKSTTMRMIMGLDAPSSGTATVNGRPYRDIHRPMFEVGAVLEARAVHGGRSAFNHLLCLAQSNGIGPRRVREVLELVGLDGVARRRAQGFSLGMAQRLGLAVALLGDPPVLLCDEPVNGLDPEGILWIRTLLRRLAEEGRTVLVSSHLMSEMALTADHVVVIAQGRLLAEGPTAQIIAHGAVSEVTLRSPQAAAFSPVLQLAGADVSPGGDGPETLRITGLSAVRVGELAAQRHITLHELTTRAPSLEEAFMALTRSHLDFQIAEANAS